MFNTLQMSVRCIRSNALRTQSIKTLINAQNYSNWVHRQPSAVINEEIVLDDAEEAPRPRKYVIEDEDHRRLRQRPRRTHKPLKKPEPVVRSDATYKEDGTPNFIKLADDDRVLMSLMMTLKSRKLRQKKEQILLEGHRLISDAIKAGLTPEIVICSRTPDIEKLSLPERGLKLYKVPYKTIQLWSSLTTTPGIVAIFKAPQSFEKSLSKDVIPLKIICDNVREPGNLGSILRAAAAVGCERVILTKGCVDVWEPKVLRSAAGAHFRVSISKSLSWDKVKNLINPGSKIYAADNNVEVNTDEFASNENSKMSNEAAIEETDPGEESNSSDELDSSDESSDEEHETSAGEELVQTKVKNEPKNAGKMQRISLRELASRLPVIPYYSVDYTNNEVVIIVGGETEGLSHDSIKLLEENGGVRVNVPLLNEVESLNTSMALGIVAFEVRRQFSIKRNAAEKLYDC